MEDSVAEEAEARNHEIDSEEKEVTIQIVKLEFIETDDEEDTKEPKPLNPIPG